MQGKRVLLNLAIILVIMALAVSPNKTQAQYSFDGKSITLIVAWDPGGRIDRQSRTIAKYLAKYLPGSPDFIVQNIPGGKAIPANLRFQKAKPDGSVILMETASGLEISFLGFPGANYTPHKNTWIGSVSTGKQRNVLYTHKQAGFNTLKDLKKKRIALGAPRVGHRSYIYGRLMEQILGLNVRWVVGYSTTELDLAIERREVDGRVNDAASLLARRPDMIKKGLVVPHVAVTLPERLPPLDYPLFANVPALMDFAKKESHREIIRKFNTTGRLSASMALPPGTPESIRGPLEAALLKVGKDRKFQKEWETLVLRGTTFGGVYSGDEVQTAARIYTQWKPEILKEYKQIGYEPPK